MNIMEVDGHKAKIEYDPETDTFRGEILGLNGGADFYGSSTEELRKEFKVSLDIFLDACKEEGLTPYKEYSGKFNLRVPPELHAEIAALSAAGNKSLNQWLVDQLNQLIHPD